MRRRKGRKGKETERSQRNLATLSHESSCNERCETWLLHNVGESDMAKGEDEKKKGEKGRKREL